MNKAKKITLALFSLAAATLLPLGTIYMSRHVKTILAPMTAEAAFHQGSQMGSTPSIAGKNPLYLLQWKENPDAVRYELRIHDRRGRLIYSNDRIYMSDFLLPPNLTEKGIPTGATFHVQAFDLDGRPVAEPTADSSLERAVTYVNVHAPLPRSVYNKGNGEDLLYPVYAYTPYPGAARYEVEVLSEEPENPNGIAPSKYREASFISELSDIYDNQPRTGNYYWRVRALDEKGLPLTVWSDARRIHLSPEDNWETGVFGDSISHGGGRLSYSPTDWNYSYESYLTTPVVNLSQSGDTSAMMVDRYDQDVSPFHLKQVLVMGGTNSLRGGVPAEEVISDLQKIQEKGRRDGTKVILMTLPPINPSQIRKALNEPTVPNWKENFEKVNAFIRTQPHIDTAAAFSEYEEMPADLAQDGLHGDWRAKAMMGQEINRFLNR